MNKLVYNYKAVVHSAASGSSFDCTLNMGLMLYLKTRYRVVGVDLPEPNEDGLSSELRKQARECLAAVVEGRKIIVSPYRPMKQSGSPSSRIVGGAFMGCRKENINYPMVTAVYYGVRCLNVCNFMNLMIDKKFDAALRDEILKSLEIYDF